MGVSLKLEPNTSWNCWLFFLLPLSAASWQSPGMDTVATAMVDMATAATATVMVDTTMEGGRLSLLLLLSQDMATTAMDMATATDMAMAMDTAMDTTDTMARGRLSLLPLLRLMPLLDMATMVMDTDTATAMDAATATDTTAFTARGRLSPLLLLRLLLSPDMDTAATVTMDTAMDTDMAMDTAMATATTDREGQLDCVSNHDVKSSVKAAMKFCC